jgi:hypothetical protein
MPVLLYKPVTESEREWLDLLERFLDSGGTISIFETMIDAVRSEDPVEAYTQKRDAETDPYMRRVWQAGLDALGGEL